MKNKKFYLIDTIGDLKKTRGILVQRMSDIKAGRRFDHMSNGHEHFVSTVQRGLDDVETRISNLEKSF